MSALALAQPAEPAAPAALPSAAPRPAPPPAAQIGSRFDVVGATSPDTRFAAPAPAGSEAVATAPEPPQGAPVDRLPAQQVLEGLVATAVAGDTRAKALLLAEIQPLVLRYCRGRLGRQETVIGSADDVAQEVCLAVVSALPGYTLKGLSFRAFVYGIAAHKVTDAFRAIGRNRAEPMADLPDTPVVQDGPEQRLLAGELTERLGHLLHTLTPRQREVLVLRIAVGLSAEETAQIVGSTPGAVRVTQHRALNRLRGVMLPGDGAEKPTTDDEVADDLAAEATDCSDPLPED